MLKTFVLFHTPQIWYGEARKFPPIFSVKEKMILFKKLLETKEFFHLPYFNSRVFDQHFSIDDKYGGWWKNFGKSFVELGVIR